MSDEKKKVWWQEKIDALEADIAELSMDRDRWRIDCDIAHKDLGTALERAVTMLEEKAALEQRLESALADLRRLSRKAVEDGCRGGHAERGAVVAYVMATGISEGDAEAAIWHFFGAWLVPRMGSPEGLAALIRQEWDWRGRV